MKKWIVSMCIVFAVSSCSNSDDNNAKADDPIYSQPYHPVTTLLDLEPGTYKYVGNKIGDQPVGLISKGAKCKDKDMLDVVGKSKVALDSIVYYNYSNNQKENNCTLSFISPRVLKNNKIVSTGIMNSKVEEFWFEKVIDLDDPTKNTEVRRTKTTYSGNMEIGFQAGYLRIEDHISNYTYSGKEKVYLYFKKD